MIGTRNESWLMPDILRDVNIIKNLDAAVYAGLNQLETIELYRYST